jgi:hypothetical protein
MMDLIKNISAREPDFYIRGKDNPYILRWYLTDRVPENYKIYLHHILRDDDDRALHDHPADSTSIIISGGYIEHFPDDIKIRRAPGQVISRKAEQLHRLELYRDLDGNVIPAWTLFTFGPKVRDWGFQCGDRWVPWQQFCDETDHGKIGRGCE